MPSNKVVINLATGLEDSERVTVAYLVGGASVEQGRQVVMFLTKEAVRLALPGQAQGVACDGCPPLPGCTSSTWTVAANSWSARSASRRASSTRVSSFPVPGSVAQLRYGSGSAGTT